MKTGKKANKRKSLTAMLALIAVVGTAFSANAATYGLYIKGEVAEEQEEQEETVSEAPGIWVESSDGWQYRLYDGTVLSNSWKLVKDKTGENYYHFGDDGFMDTGWFKDTNGNWYYLNTDHDGTYGAMIRGWHEDKEDGHKYYLDTKTGIMVTGNAVIDGQSYDFNDTPAAETWTQDSNGIWHYNGNSALPYGAMR